MQVVHIYLFGLGNVGSKLVQLILNSQQFFKDQHNLDLKIVGLANSRKVYTNCQGVRDNWKQDFESYGQPRTPDAFYQFASDYDNPRIAVDATASNELSQFYPEIAQQGFHIVTANKIANTLSQEFYDQLRSILKSSGLQFEYETNVGAGLPIVETVKHLYHSGERLFSINGVFSGSLGYIFNRYSQENVTFSSIVRDALENGYTEPDPREDLSGNDVARKLLVLAREAGLQLEFEEINIQNLVPVKFQQYPLEQFLEILPQLDQSLALRKSLLKENEVLRHLGQLDVEKKTLRVSLKAVSKESPAGQLQGSDGFFEIYSQSYAKEPLVIKGAGAGREVTARGLLSDIIKISKRL